MSKGRDVRLNPERGRSNRIVNEKLNSKSSIRMTVERAKAILDKQLSKEEMSNQDLPRAARNQDDKGK